MTYLSREASSLSEDLWSRIDQTVVNSARRILTGRRFLPLCGPLGMGVRAVPSDLTGQVEEIEKDGIAVTGGRTYKELPMVHEDFMILGADLAASAASGLADDLSSAAAAAAACAVREDRLIFQGAGKFGYAGLMTVQGRQTVKKSDWSQGENPFTDCARAMELLVDKGIYGDYTLVVSPDVYVQMQRIQSGTGVLELERIEKLLQGHVYRTPVLEKGQAVMVCAEEENMDLVIGQDMAAAYLEQTGLNHYFRITESLLLRVKRPGAVVTFG